MDDIHLTTDCGTRARIAPDSGFCCLSWRVGDAEHLHLPVPEAEFRSKPKTGGVPLLYPYANRLRSDPWPDHPEVKRDNGLPCHGFLLRFEDWTDVRVEQQRATAVLDWARHDDLMALFPHAHRLEVTFEVAPGSLRATTVVEADGSDHVPISFGWHPYLALPGVAHDQLSLRLPPLEHVHLDDRGLPVRDGEGALCKDTPEDFSGSLEGREFDDLYQRPEFDSVFALEGPSSTINVRMDRNWGFIQLYSPTDGNFACIEPMTGPVAALSDGRDHPTIAPGERFEASFELSVSS
jgi:aldose 1-epimerase